MKISIKFARFKKTILTEFKLILLIINVYNSQG